MQGCLGLLGVSEFPYLCCPVWLLISLLHGRAPWLRGVVNVSLCPIGSWSISRESVVLRLGTQPPFCPSRSYPGEVGLGFQICVQFWIPTWRYMDGPYMDGPTYLFSASPNSALSAITSTPQDKSAASSRNASWINRCILKKDPLSSWNRKYLKQLIGQNGVNNKQKY